MDEPEGYSPFEETSLSDAAHAAAMFAAVESVTIASKDGALESLDRGSDTNVDVLETLELPAMSQEVAIGHARKTPEPPPIVAVPIERVSNAYLESIDGAAPQRLYLLENEECVIGRSGVCTIHMRRRRVSRTHARILKERSGYVVEDLESTNGTFVNGERVSGRRSLRSGDRLDIGGVASFVVKLPEQAERREERPPSSRSFAADETTTSTRSVAFASNLTQTQLLFWMGAKLQPNIPLETASIRFLFTIEGGVDPVHFQRAMQALVDRSDALRLAVREVDGIPMWHITDPRPFAVENVRLSSDPDPDAALARFVDGKRKIYMSPETPIASSLVEMSPTRHVWYLAVHHLIGDLRSVAVIVQQVAQYYELSLGGQLDADTTPLPTFAEYSQFEREQRDLETYKQAGAYWRKLVSEIRQTQRDRGPVSRVAPDPELLRTEQLSYELTAEETAAVARVMKSARIFSPSLAFLTVLYASLARVSENPHAPICVGTTYANRPRRFQNTIGLFMSTCPIWTRIDEHDTFLSLATKLQAEATAGSANQHHPPSHGKIYDAFFNFLGVGFGTFAGRPMRAERIRLGYSNSAFGLAVRDFNATGRLTVDFELRVDRSLPERRRETVQQYVRLLRAFLTDGNQRIAPLL